MYLGCHQPKKRFDILMDIPAQESEFHLAPDHVHVHVESDGERSVEDMVFDIKKVSAKAILDEFSSLQEILGEVVGLWDDAYFVETAG
jgi:REP element-mobilizing transposase RayT